MKLIDRATITEEVAITLAEQSVRAKLGAETDPRFTVFCCALIKAEVVPISALEEIYCRRVGRAAANRLIPQIEFALTQFAALSSEPYHDAL